VATQSEEYNKPNQPTQKTRGCLERFKKHFISTEMQNRFTGLMFHIDTNRINARQRLGDMNKLEEWANNDVISLDMAEITLNEAVAGNNKQRTKKALGYIYSKTYATTPEENKLLQRIERILFPEGADTENKRNDVEIVFNAVKYGRILVTNDGDSKTQPNGILGNAKRLKREVGVIVVTDTEAVSMVRNRIEARDQNCRYHSKRTGEKLPEWVGRD